MKLKKFLLYSYIMVFPFLSSTIFAASKALYAGDPEFAKLSAAIVNNTLFANGPHCNVAQTNLLSHAFDTNAYYSHYQMNTVAYQGFKTKYWTKETIAPDQSQIPGAGLGQGAIVNGKGISYSGIFWPLEEMTAYNQHGDLVYYNKIAITSMRHVSGALFPLKAGNDLKFYFTRSHVRKINGTSYMYNENGIMEYKVIKHLAGYPYSKIPVPGDVYTIEVSESTNLHPQRYLTDIYNYSAKLGWYITDQYFNTNNKSLAIYRLRDWYGKKEIA